MSMQDPIADMLTRIRNAGMASLKEIVMPSSRIKASLAEVFKQEGYIQDYVVEGEGVKKNLKITVKYFQNKPVIEGIERVSRPSCRVYCSATDVPMVRNGLGTVVLSTPKGIITGKNAKSSNVGGEVLCYIW